MIRSAAIIKTQTSWEKLRLQKRKLKKEKEIERKATREIRPSPIKKRVRIEIADNAPPTRAELETKAKELGIKFDGRTKDKKLGQLIEERL